MNKIGAHKTSVYRDGEATVVRYHETAVVTIHDSGPVVLNSGGHKTATTKRRMNQASRHFGLGFHVYQQNFEWYVVHLGETMPFKDGMELHKRTVY